MNTHCEWGLFLIIFDKKTDACATSVICYIVNAVRSQLDIIYKIADKMTTDEKKNHYQCGICYLLFVT